MRGQRSLFAFPESLIRSARLSGTCRFLMRAHNPVAVIGI
jgi:hypothetical protein